MFSSVYALEGITTRIPTAAALELATVSLWTVPWMLLLVSGVEDLSIVSRKESVLWLGVAGALLFLFYFDRFTSMSFLTKAAMPPLRWVRDWCLTSRGKLDSYSLFRLSRQD